jgi:hypothetical protein
LFSLGLGLDAKANQNKETKAILTSIKLIKKNNNTLSLALLGSPYIAYI